MKLSDIKMAWKIALITFILSLGTIGVALVGWRGLELLRFHQSNIYSFMLIPIVAINQADAALAGAQFQLEALKSSTLSAANQSASIESIKAAETEASGTFTRYDTEWVTTVSPEFTAILRDFGRLDLQEDEVAALATLHRTYDTYILVREAYLTSVQAGTPDNQLANSALNLLTEIRSNLRRLIEVNNEFAEISNQAALSAYEQALVNMGLAIGFTVVLGLILSFMIARSITQRLGNLAQDASSLQQGNLEQPMTITGRDEIGILAQAFNAMAVQLRDLVRSLETRVAERTRVLAVSADISRYLSTVLNFNQLLAEVVNRIKDALGYYHAHIYLFDERREKLVVAEGTGSAGAEMKAKGHNIRLEAPTSLVARAARTGEIIRVDNVREAADWLPNPLLPDTYSEMAVPIILEGQVVGVLDVQSDQIAGLDEGDANLLRSLTSQVAVALHKARQFAEVETALAGARETQRRYMEQAWEQSKMTHQHGAYHYHRPGVLPLSEAVTAQLERQVLVQNQPTIVEVNGTDDQRRSTKAEVGAENLAPHNPEATLETQTPASQNQTALVAPIRLLNQTIGTIQLYETERPHHWSERDLALVEAVTEQMAQAAENIRLFEETRERATREQTIREVTDKLRATPNLDTLLETATRELGQRLGVEHTVLRLGLEQRSESSGDGPLEAQNGSGQGR